jgi:hypothetical protein
MKLLAQRKIIFGGLFISVVALVASTAIAYAASVAADTVGIWQLSVNGGLWVWEIHPDGTYEFHSEAPDGVAPHAGKFAASGGVWSLQATNGYTDGGTYTLQGPDTLVATGHLGTGSWHRVTNSTRQALPGDSSAQSVADRIKSHNIEIAHNFSPAWGIQCSPGGADDHFALRCHADLSDAERSSQSATLDFLIYDSEPDFGGEDALLAAAVQRMPGRWHVDDQPNVSLQGADGTIHPKMSCHQSLGDSSGPAFCLVQAGPHVLIIAAVRPAQPSTESIDGNPSSATYDDIRHATTLAIMGVAHLASAP